MAQQKKTTTKKDEKKEKPYAAKARANVARAGFSLESDERESADALAEKLTTSAALTRVSEYFRALAREKSITASLQTKILEGAVVRIVGGDPKHIGLVGRVSSARRIRALVEVPDHDREIYAFLTDLEQCDESELRNVDDEDDEDSDLEREDDTELSQTGTDG